MLALLSGSQRVLFAFGRLDRCRIDQAGCSSLTAVHGCRRVGVGIFAAIFTLLLEFLPRFGLDLLGFRPGGLVGSAGTRRCDGCTSDALGILYGGLRAARALAEGVPLLVVDPGRTEVPYDGMVPGLDADGRLLELGAEDMPDELRADEPCRVVRPLVARVAAGAVDPEEADVAA